MQLVGSLIGDLLWIYLLLLFVRMIMSWVEVLSPQWRPRGPLLVVLEIIYSLTDPPLRLVRRFIPPLNLGGARLDLGFMVLWLALVILMQVNAAIFMRA